MYCGYLAFASNQRHSKDKGDSKFPKLATSHKTRQQLEFGSFESSTSFTVSGLGTAPAARGAGKRAAPNIEARTTALPSMFKGFGSKHVTMARAFTLYLNGAGVPSSWPASGNQKNQNANVQRNLLDSDCPSVWLSDRGPPW